MRTHSRRIMTAVGLALGGAFLFSGAGTGCMSFTAESGLTSTNFCFIFDCQNGILGGTIDPCAGIGIDDRSGQEPMLVDCPGFVEP